MTVMHEDVACPRCEADGLGLSREREIERDGQTVVISEWLDVVCLNCRLILSTPKRVIRIREGYDS